MLDGLPREYDVIVVGTGMVESILAAACARIGKSVLHIDINDYYGGEWASFSLDALTEWTAKSEQEGIKISPQDESETILPIANPTNIFRNVQLKWNIPDSNEQSSATDDDSPKPVTLDVLKKQSRKFNIDLTPKLFYASGGLIDLLVESNVGKYCEFKLVSRLLFERDGQLDRVPSSRADIFNSDNINLIDKRLLMKVMMNCSSMSIDDGNEELNLPFIDYLKKQKLNDQLCHLIINSISMVDYDATTREGVTRAKRYMNSLGRYGNSPFLYQMYGNGEMSQAFCRLCAVFGGIQFLRFPLAAFTIDSSTNQCTGIVASSGERFRAKDRVICNNAYLESASANRDVLHRIVLFTNQSIKSSEKEEITYLRLSGPNEPGIHVIEVGNGPGCAPDGYFLLYLFPEKAQKGTSDNTDQIIERLLKSTANHFTRANILGQFTCDQVQTIAASSLSSAVSKLSVTHGPDGTIDHDSAVNTARNLFHEIYSNREEFLARAPDPEDIIIEDPNNTDETSTTATENETAATS